jgi:hypothetical protein
MWHVWGHERCEKSFGVEEFLEDLDVDGRIILSAY